MANPENKYFLWQKKKEFFPWANKAPDCLISQPITSRLGLSWARLLAHAHSLPSSKRKLRFRFRRRRSELPLFRTGERRRPRLWRPAQPHAGPAERLYGLEDLLS